MRKSETSLIAKACVTRPSVLMAVMAKGFSTASSAKASRSGKASSEKVFIKKPTVPQFMP